MVGPKPPSLPPKTWIANYAAGEDTTAVARLNNVDTSQFVPLPMISQRNRFSSVGVGVCAARHYLISSCR